MLDSDDDKNFEQLFLTILRIFLFVFHNYFAVTWRFTQYLIAV